MPEETTKKIYAAISGVQADLAQVGVGKDAYNQQQRFNYRSWDAVQQALAPILAEHHVLIIPRIIRRHESHHQTKNGGNMFKVVLEGRIEFVSGEDGSTYAYPAIGEAMDSGDKATSKAITMMVKYAVIHALCIPLEGMADADGDTPPETGDHKPQPPQRPTPPNPNGNGDGSAKSPRDRAIDAAMEWSGLPGEEKRAVVQACMTGINMEPEGPNGTCTDKQWNALHMWIQDHMKKGDDFIKTTNFQQEPVPNG